MNKPSSRLVSILFSAGLLTSAFVISSCDDEKDSIRPEIEIPDNFSERTIEQNKEALEDNGIELVNSLTALQNTAGVQTSISFGNFLSNASLPDNSTGAIGNSELLDLMRSLSRFGQGKTSASTVLKGMRMNEEEQTLQEIFDENEGTFTYNGTTNTWDFTASPGSGRIEFKFPSTETGQTNNATFAIHSYASVNISNEAAEYEGDLPTSLKADLTVGTTKQIEYTFTAAYKSNGEPTSVITSLTIGTFKLSFEAKNTTSEVSVDYALTQNGNNLLSLGAGAAGNFTTEDNEEAEVGDVVTDAGAYFQIMDIRFAGEVKVKSLDLALQAASSIEAEVEAYNDFVTFVVFYAEEKTKIADAEFYGTVREDCYVIDWETGEEYCETYDVVDVRLVFADDSKADLATYTEVGFAELEAAFEEFFDGLEADING